jgi:hypothetical protein
MIVNRILQVIEAKGLNKRKFYLKTGLSNGFLDKVQDVGVSKVEIILSAFPDINPIWLLSGDGPMLKNLGLMTEEQMTQHDKEVADGKWHHYSKSDKDFSEIDLYKARTDALTKENEELKLRLSEYTDRILEQKETINAQKELIALLKKSQPKPQPITADKSEAKV